MTLIFYFLFLSMAFVKSCPTTQDTYLEASRRLGCVNDTYHHNQYICLPNTEKTSLVELCNNAIMGIQDKGYLNKFECILLVKDTNKLLNIFFNEECFGVVMTLNSLNLRRF